MDICGIYQILNLTNNKFYIGSSYRILKRWKDHKRCLRENKHPNKIIQAAYRKYGEEAFEFIIVEVCNRSKLIEREQFWIDNLNCVAPKGYNANPNASSRLGTKHSEETLAKLRAKVISEEHKLAISRHTKGRKASEETKLKIKNGNLGKKNTEQSKETMRQAWAKRKGEDYKPFEITSKPLVKGELGWI